jgi:hypothetical protein
VSIRIEDAKHRYCLEEHLLIAEVRHSAMAICICEILYL